MIQGKKGSTRCLICKRSVKSEADSSFPHSAQSVAGKMNSEQGISVRLVDPKIGILWKPMTKLFWAEEARDMNTKVVTEDK